MTFRGLWSRFFSTLFWLLLTLPEQTDLFYSLFICFCPLWLCPGLPLSHVCFPQIFTLMPDWRGLKLQWLLLLNNLVCSLWLLANIEPCPTGAGKNHASHLSQKIKCRQRQMFREPYWGVESFSGPQDLLILCVSQCWCTFTNCVLRRTRGWAKTQNLKGKKWLHSLFMILWFVCTLTQQKSARKGFWLR